MVSTNKAVTNSIRVDIKQGMLLLQLDGDLKSSQKIQLYYWGFKKNNIGYQARHKDKYLLLKLSAYFKKEGISFSLSDVCIAIIRGVQSHEKEFESILSMARSYKNGDAEQDKIKNIISGIKQASKRALKDHQIKAATHLYLSKNGANFSVPGSGKTSVAISVYEKLRQEGKVNTLFVVGPPSCFQPWRDEFKTTLGRNPKYHVLAGGNPAERKSKYFETTNQKPELYLTSFQTLLQDHIDVATFMKRQGMDIYLIIDEAHYIKKIEGNWATIILDISKYAKFRCVLTGTPMPKSYTDMYNIFDFLWPEHNPLDSSTKIRIEQLERSGNYESVKDILKSKIGPLFYRVRKSDLKLKTPHFHNLVIKMNKYEKLIYDLIESRISEFSKEDYLQNIDIVKRLRRGRIIRLRQSVSYPRLLLSAIEGYDENLLKGDAVLSKIIRDYDNYELPAKMQKILEIAQKSNNENQKIIIWTNFVKTIEFIQDILRENRINCKSIYGKTPIEQQSIQEEETREKIRHEFLDLSSGLNVLIANPAACAESISLHTTCHTAVYYDLSYNCAQYLQSLDRIHRVGGSEAVDTHYYFLQYPNTIDVDISRNLNEKAKRMNALIEQDYNIYNLDMVGDDDEQAYLRLFRNNRK